MNQSSKNARTRLKKSTRKEFESLVYEAMLTPIQARVLRLHIAEGVGVPRTCGCGCNRRVLGVNYDVDFGANVAIPEGGTVAPISVAISLGGTAIPSSIMTVTPAAAGDFFNISRDITAQIVAGCCQTVAVQNLSTVPIEMIDASINFDREGVSVMGVM